MKCLICGSESANEVCNKCIRLEKILYQKEWNFKEGMLIKKRQKPSVLPFQIFVSAVVLRSAIIRRD